LLDAGFCQGAVEAVGVSQTQRFLVVSQRSIALVQAVEADCKVKGVIGIARCCAIGFEISGLCVNPALLLGIQVTECLIQLWTGFAINQTFQAAFRSQPVRVAQQVEQGGLRGGIARITLQNFSIQPGRVVITAKRRGNRGEPQQRVGAALAGGCLSVEPLGVAELATLLSGVSVIQQRSDGVCLK
jgi:hypothetical protein